MASKTKPIINPPGMTQPCLSLIYETMKGTFYYWRLMFSSLFSLHVTLAMWFIVLRNLVYVVNHKSFASLSTKIWNNYKTLPIYHTLLHIPYPSIKCKTKNPLNNYCYKCTFHKSTFYSPHIHYFSAIF